MGSDRVAVRVLQILWLLLPLALAPALAGALDGRSTGVVVATLAGLWAAWAVGLVAVLVPSNPSLTVVRILVPLAVVAAVASALAGAGVGPTVLGVVGALAVTLVAYSAEVGSAFAQESAYGDERRFLLRPPGALVVGPLPLAWSLMVGPTIAGVLLLGAAQWLAGALFLVVGIGLVTFLGPRCHRLARRFLVLVPAGLVVHDHLVLADTTLFRRAEVASVGLAEVGTTATDLTGRALGPAVEVRLRRPATVVPASTLQQRQSESVAVDAFLVAPSRPGRFLAEAVSRSLPAA